MIMVLSSRVQWENRIRNDRIPPDWIVNLVEEAACKSHLRWFSHVPRMKY